MTKKELKERRLRLGFSIIEGEHWGLQRVLLIHTWIEPNDTYGSSGNDLVVCLFFFATLWRLIWLHSLLTLWWPCNCPSDWMSDKRLILVAGPATAAFFMRASDRMGQLAILYAVYEFIHGSPKGRVGGYRERVTYGYEKWGYHLQCHSCALKQINWACYYNRISVGLSFTA